MPANPSLIRLCGRQLFGQGVNSNEIIADDKAGIELYAQLLYILL